MRAANGDRPTLLGIFVRARPTCWMGRRSFDERIALGEFSDPRRARDEKRPARESSSATGFFESRSDGAPKRPVAGPHDLGRRRHRLVLRVRLEDAFAHGVLRPRVHDRPEQSEAPPLAVDRVLPRRERDVPAGPTAPLPDREADQLQAGEDTITEVQLGVG